MKQRELKGPVKALIGFLTVAGSLWAIFYVLNIPTRVGLVLSTLQFVASLIACFLPLAFFVLPATKRAASEKLPWYDALAALFCFAGPLYIAINYDAAKWGSWSILPPTDVVILGGIICFLVLEAVRRASGPVLALTALVFSGLPLYVQYLPGFLKGRPFSLENTVGYLFAGDNGMFGLPARVFGMVVITFIIFGIAVQVTGGGRFFLNADLSLLGRTRGGAA